MKDIDAHRPLQQGYMPHQLVRHAGLSSHAARYLHALCCVKLGKLGDAQEVLTKFGELEVGGAASRAADGIRHVQQMESVMRSR